MTAWADAVAAESSVGTARHEAAHAVGALRLGLKVEHVSIVPGEDRHGNTRYIVNELREGDTAASVVIKLLGYLGEGECPDPWPPDYAVACVTKAEGLGDSMRYVTRAHYKALMGIAFELAHSLPFKRDVELVADELLRRGYLTGDDVKELLQR